ncbi:MAG: PspC domain-containing protein [Bifidobacteriaceae bacterium]|jgi:phage shock protein PspC (stress-responsive transcriptional regulator)|nr:PspC domain-containing protein [Bifidobacteriaceae bacterium]
MDMANNSAPPPPYGTGPAPANGFFQWIRERHIVRTEPRWVGGVAGGLALRLGWDPVLVRGLFVVAALFSGLGLFLYGAGWLLLPEARDGRIHLEEAIAGRFSPGFWGGATFALMGLIGTPVWIAIAGVFGLIWLVVVAVAAVVTWGWASARRSGRTGPAQPAAPAGGFPPPVYNAAASQPPAPPAPAPASGPGATAAGMAGASATAAAAAAQSVASDAAPTPSKTVIVPPAPVPAKAGEDSAAGDKGSATDVSTETAGDEPAATADPKGTGTKTEADASTETAGDEPAPAADPKGDGAKTEADASTETTADGSEELDGPKTEGVEDGAATDGSAGASGGNAKTTETTAPTDQTAILDDDPTVVMNQVPGADEGTPDHAASAARPPAGPPAAASPPGRPPYPPRTRAPRRRKGGAVTAVILGLMLMAVAGVLAIARYTSFFSGLITLGAFAFGLAVTITGLGLVVLGAMGRRLGAFLAASIVMALIALPVATGAEALSFSGGRLTIGTTYCHPRTVDQAEDGCYLTLGELRAEYTDLDLRPGQTVRTEVSMGIGALTLVVPKDAKVSIQADLRIGDLDARELEPKDWEFVWSAGLPGAGGDRHVVEGDLYKGSEASQWGNGWWSGTKSASATGRNELGGLGLHLTAASQPTAENPPTLNITVRGAMGQLRILER